MKLDAETKKNIGALIVLIIVSIASIVVGYITESQFVRTLCYGFGMLLFLFSVLAMMYLIAYSRAIRFAKIKKTKFRFKEEQSK